MARVVASGQDTLDELAANIVRLFTDAEQRLNAALAAQVRAGLNASEQDVVRALRLADLRDLAQQVSERVSSRVPEEAEAAMKAARESGQLAVAQELMVARAGGAATLAAQVQSGIVSVSTDMALRGVLGSAPAAVALTAELTSGLQDVTRRILRWPDDVYRRAVAQSATDLLLGLGKATQRSAQVAAWQRIVSEGVKGFTDTAGRRWNLASYAEMATRTSVRRAWDIQHETTMKTSNISLCTIVVGSGACKACADQAGKIFRLDAGPTGRIKAPSSVDPTKTVTVNVQGTLDDARSHGWRHPNCRCRPVAYLPGLSLVEDVTTYDPQAEADRARLRGLERDVRQAKAQAASAVSPEQRNAEQARVRALQGQIRDHTKATGLARQPNREQLDLGNRPQR